MKQSGACLCRQEKNPGPFSYQTSQPLGTIKLEVEVSKPGDFSENLEFDLMMLKKVRY